MKAPSFLEGNQNLPDHNEHTVKVSHRLAEQLNHESKGTFLKTTQESLHEKKTEIVCFFTKRVPPPLAKFGTISFCIVVWLGGTSN